jgi:hypothetical protein
MNNQFNLFEDTRGFILDTPKDMKHDFFWCWLLAFVVSSFPLLRIDRAFSFHFTFFFLLLHSLPQSFLAWPSIYGFSSSSPFSIIGFLF